MYCDIMVEPTMYMYSLGDLAGHRAAEVAPAEQPPDQSLHVGINEQREGLGYIVTDGYEWY